MRTYTLGITGANGHQHTTLTTFGHEAMAIADDAPRTDGGTYLRGHRARR
jgi:hypothetical protein